LSRGLAAGEDARLAALDARFGVHWRPLRPCARRGPRPL